MPTEFLPNKLIAWKTVEGSTIGHAAAWRVGSDPKTQMDADLARMKTLLETGIPPHDAARKEPA